MKRHEFHVGEYARNIESGWIGRIEEIFPPREVKVDDTQSFMETMARLQGVNLLVCTVAGVPWDQALDDDDVQWHSVNDLVPVRTVQ